MRPTEKAASHDMEATTAAAAAADPAAEVAVAVANTIKDVPPAAVATSRQHNSG